MSRRGTIKAVSSDMGRCSDSVSFTPSASAKLRKFAKHRCIEVPHAFGVGLMAAVHLQVLEGHLVSSGWWLTWLTYPSEKMMESVSWDDDIPNIWKNKTCSKPPTRHTWAPHIVCLEDHLWKTHWHEGAWQQQGCVLTSPDVGMHRGMDLVKPKPVSKA